MGWNYLSIPKLQRCNRWSLGMDKWFHPTLYWACDYLSMLGLKLNHVSKSGPRNQQYWLNIGSSWICNGKSAHSCSRYVLCFLVDKCIILWMHPANERRRYNVMSSLIDGAHAQNDPPMLRPATPTDPSASSLSMPVSKCTLKCIIKSPDCQKLHYTFNSNLIVIDCNDDKPKHTVRFCLILHPPNYACLTLASMLSLVFNSSRPSDA